jgi:hypothetical protein
MNIDQLQELKQKLTKESDFSQIWLFYMEHFADHQEFTELGEPARNEYLETITPQICQQMLGRTIAIADSFLIYIAEHHFFHGPLQVEGRIGGIIYFEDIKMGLLALSADYPPTDAVKYSRFSEPIGPSEPNPYDLN